MTRRPRVQRLAYGSATAGVLLLPALAFTADPDSLAPSVGAGFMLLGFAFYLHIDERRRALERAVCLSLFALFILSLFVSDRATISSGATLALLLCAMVLMLIGGRRPRPIRSAQAVTVLIALLALASLLMHALTQADSLRFLRGDWVMTPAAVVLALLAVTALAVLLGGLGAATRLLRGQPALQVTCLLLALVVTPAAFVSVLSYLLTVKGATEVALLALVLVSVMTYALISVLVVAGIKMHRESASLAKSQQWFRRAWDSSGIGMALVAKDGSWLSCNARLGGIVGYSEAELRKMTFQDITHPEDLALDLGEMQKVLDGESEGYEMRKRYFHKDGHIVWIQLNVGKLKTERGELYCFLSSIQDISARVQAEAKLAAAMDTLEVRVEERTREMRVVNSELDAFTQSVSHDLRAPLRALDGFSRILIEAKASQLDDEAKRYLARIRAGSQRMGELIDGLLQLSRVSRKPISRIDLDLAEIARQVIEDLRAVEPGRVVDFSCPAVLPAWGDPALLRSVMINVLGNAWKYSADQAVARIRVDAEWLPDSLRCVVSDNGSGFDMAYREKLFQPFQRLHTDVQAPGFGLGLATVRRIIAKHGGQCDIEARPGQGAVFQMTLPLRR